MALRRETNGKALAVSSRRADAVTRKNGRIDWRGPIAPFDQLRTVSA